MFRITPGGALGHQGSSQTAECKVVRWCPTGCTTAQDFESAQDFQLEIEVDGGRQGFDALIKEEEKGGERRRDGRRKEQNRGDYILVPISSFPERAILFH